MNKEDQPPRIGVFLCRCGTNIAGVINIPNLVEHVKTLSGITHVGENLHTCSSEGLKNLKEAIKKHNLERVVVAACSPRTHEPLFREALEEVGLNKYLFQMVNIREQDSWVHKETGPATEKAKYLVQMAVNKARFLEPESEIEIEVIPTSLVIGGGVAGLTASLNLTEQGFNVVIVEKEPNLGGALRDLYTIYPTRQKASEVLNPLLKKVVSNDKIKILTSSTVDSVKGFLGNFEVRVSGDGGTVSDLQVGTIIVATGSTPLEPRGYYRYGELPNVITQLELEKRLKNGENVPKRVVMIQCVGAMEDKGRTYCSRICCGVAIKNALEIKRILPTSEVSIIYRDLQAYGIELEELYRESLDSGIRFINYLSESPPKVESRVDGGVRIIIYDPLLESNLEIDTELLVLSTPLINPEKNKDLAKTLRVPLSSDGFYLEAHPKMRPVDFSSEGIFLCGTAHSPKNIEESVSQALAAASRAAIPMSLGKVKTEAITSVLNQELCVGCGACSTACPFDAIDWGYSGYPHINESVCKGCGVCAVECPTGAMQLRYFKDNQIIPAVSGLLEPSRWLNKEKESDPVILCFACKWCSYAAADFAGIMRLSYPVNVRLILVPCSGRVDFRHIFEAFQRGADGVIVAGCLKEQCHYVDGNILADRRIMASKKALENLGIGSDRLEMFFCSAGMPREFADFMREFTFKIGEKGVIQRDRIPALAKLIAKEVN